MNDRLRMSLLATSYPKMSHSAIHLTINAVLPDAIVAVDPRYLQQRSWLTINRRPCHPYERSSA